MILENWFIFELEANVKVFTMSCDCMHEPIELNHSPIWRLFQLFHTACRLQSEIENGNIC